MAAGDLVVADWQFEIRATLMGPTTNYEIKRESGMFGGLLEDNIELVEVPYAHAQGSFVGQARDAARTANFPLLITGSTPAAVGTGIDAMRTAWAKSTEAIPLYFQLPGIGKHYVMGWPLGILPAMETQVINQVRTLASFRITDPTIYT